MPPTGPSLRREHSASARLLGGCGVHREANGRPSRLNVSTPRIWGIFEHEPTDVRVVVQIVQRLGDPVERVRKAQPRGKIDVDDGLAAMLRAVPDFLQSAIRHIPLGAVCVPDSGPAQGHLLDVTHHVTRFDAIADTESIIEKDEEARDVVTQQILRPEGDRHTEKTRAGNHCGQGNVKLAQDQDHRGEPDHAGDQLLVQRAERLRALRVTNGRHRTRIDQRPRRVRTQHRQALPHPSVEHSPHDTPHEARKHPRQHERSQDHDQDPQPCPRLGLRRRDRDPVETVTLRHLDQHLASEHNGPGDHDPPRYGDTFIGKKHPPFAELRAESFDPSRSDR